jgi:uncharacterized protein YdhG (YjbR/CyaY superfamily)
MKNGKEPKTIDEYIATQPPNVQALLQQIRQTIHKAAPEAQETISYQMPAFKQGSILVWFAAFKNHIGFFPKASGIEAFKEQLAPYKTSKGTVQFPLDQPLPLEIIAEIVRFRVKEQAADFGLP